jgi:hypothetical protein
MSKDWKNAMCADNIVAMLDDTKDRAELLALLAPLRLPPDLSNNERSKITIALISAATRC